MLDRSWKELKKTIMSELSHTIGIKERFSKKIEAVKSFDVLAGVKQKLIDSKHPYGLLLMSTPLLMASTGSQITGAGLSASSSIVESSSDTHKGTTGKFVKDLSSAGSVGLAVSGESPAASLISTGLGLSLSAETEDPHHGMAALFLSSFGLSAAADPNIAKLFEQSFYYNKDAELGMLLAPSLNKLDSRESVPNILVGKDKLKVGSVQANVFVYSGKNEYKISGDNILGEETVKPGDKFLAIHVNANAEKYKKLSTIARVKQIRNDFRDFCALLNNPEEKGLNQEELEFVKTLKEAPIVGVSHLVKLLDAKKAPTWNISILPAFFKKFHTVDSQMVSKFFGGQRKVIDTDIKVLFLPARMRDFV